MDGFAARQAARSRQAAAAERDRGAGVGAVPGRAGSLKLDEILTRSYPIEEINQAYDALQSGETLRSVVTF
ncbi:MAG: hypothetical protein GY798_04960 [Hyphomicrobiales bacterium]|nr:hypothetical protein [Hyphomicrobiales bacterium]